ncbi:DUF4145 domain-containing protein [Altererythrobacter xiamenensis]|uniref:DUF4145 domain-containing protein n=1 Tax=Altererythrobacter xiamenensis TaxID=1316679 RepID=UPI0011780296|nr:DUF4145 domain-containing protein [Altererythrobacter xiamenensis]
MDFIRPKYEMRNFWPSRSIDVPENLPKNVENFYLQGLESLRAERWDAAGAMFRKSLDVGTKLISPELKSESLFSRINTLVERHLLTEAMGQWSHEIRIDGNGAVHDELPETESDANAIQKFTEAFLRYAFTLPSMVAQNRSKRDEKSPANESEKSAG